MRGEYWEAGILYLSMCGSGGTGVPRTPEAS
jgi:hypothetical protein